MMQSRNGLPNSLISIFIMWVLNPPTRLAGGVVNYFLFLPRMYLPSVHTTFNPSRLNTLICALRQLELLNFTVFCDTFFPANNKLRSFSALLFVFMVCFLLVYIAFGNLSRTVSNFNTLTSSFFLK